MSGYQWTAEDADFAGSVDAALAGLMLSSVPGIPAAKLAEWHECCRRWGPRSRSALGCLLGFVTTVWSDHCWDVGVDYTGASFDVIDGPSIIEARSGSPSLDQLAGALLAALEAAPRMIELRTRHVVQGPACRVCGDSGRVEADDVGPGLAPCFDACECDAGDTWNAGRSLVGTRVAVDKEKRR